ncbi:MAG: hypothetical protein WCT28_01870 [Patescibacteria group bacterium]
MTTIISVIVIIQLFERMNPCMYWMTHGRCDYCSSGDDHSGWDDSGSVDSRGRWGY